MVCAMSKHVAGTLVDIVGGSNEQCNGNYRREQLGEGWTAAVQEDTVGKREERELEYDMWT